LFTSHLEESLMALLPRRFALPPLRGGLRGSQKSLI
jgi:hypothetical protein